MVVDRLRLVGLLSAALVTFLGSAQDHTFSVISFYTQSAISLPLPLVSVLLMTRDFGRRTSSLTTGSGLSRDPIIAAKLLASMIIAVAGAVYGVLISVLATSAATPGAGEGRWNAIGMIILGSLLVQFIAQLVGAGWGMLLGSSTLAIVADIVVPLGLWIVAGAVPGLQGVQGWLAPFASVRNLLSGRMDGQLWAQVGVIALVWVVALNAAGIFRVHRLSESDGR
jgi:ABC-type transport system involved in multi-copper enzyme maturation permease subunit